MKKLIMIIALLIFAVSALLISVFGNAIIGFLLLIAVILFCNYIRNPEKSINNLILIAVFLCPCADIFVYKTGFYDLKILPFLWTVILGAILIHKAVRKQCTITEKDYAGVIFALYIVVLIFSCIFSIDIEMSFKELIQYIYLFLLMYIIYMKTKDKDFFNKVIVAIIISNIFLVAVSLISYFSGRVIIPAYDIYKSGGIVVRDSLYNAQALVKSGEIINRMQGILGLDTIGIANAILIQSIFVNYMIRVTAGKKRLLFICLIVADFAAINFTYSRNAILLFLMMHLITFFSRDPMKNLAVVFVAVCGIIVFLTTFPIVFERVLEAFNPEEGSIKYHFVVWLATLQTGYDHIFTGIGLGNMAYNYGEFASFFYNSGLYEINAVNVHNFILQIWAEQGIVGVIINAILLFGPILYYIKVRYIKRVITGKSLYDFVMLAYLTTLLNNLTNNSFYIETFWVIAALVYAGKHHLMRMHMNNSEIKQRGGVIDRNLSTQLS